MFGEHTCITKNDFDSVIYDFSFDYSTLYVVIKVKKKSQNNRSTKKMNS